MKLKRSTYDVAVNLICLVLLLGTVVYFVANWGEFPDRVPGHYNAMGEVDRWGNKGELLITLIIAWIMYLGMTAIERFPQVWNTGVRVTEENKKRVYRILKNMIVTLKLTVVAIFVFLAVNSASASQLPLWFLPAFLILIFGSIIFFGIKLSRAK
ncbi:MAG TPA: DUF1648 domain-containing protein [Clostridiales bacterium]|nr:DUF1648 domain-containing protein [Clostridiales bacterium]